MTRESAPKGALTITAAKRDQPNHTTETLHISDSLRVMLLKQFTLDQLRHLVNLKAQDSPGLRARQQLDDAGVNDLVELIVGGGIPTMGWWNRHTQGGPATPVRSVAPTQAGRPRPANGGTPHRMAS